MVRIVPEHVANRVRDFPRGPQHVRVIAIGKDGPAPLHHAIEGARHADLEALHSARQRFLAVRLDDEVQVIALNRVMHEAKPEPIAAAFEGSLQREQCPPAAQVPAAFGHPQGGVDWVAR